MKDVSQMIEEAKFFFHSHKYEQAEELFKKVLAGRKEFADVHNYLGLIAHEEGRYGEAIESFKKALKTNPRYTEAMLNLSILYNDIGEYNSAKKLVSQSRKEARTRETAIDPFIRSKLANMHAHIADWYHGVGAYSEAVDEYGKALELEDGYADIRTKMAVCLREKNDLKSALKELNRAVKTSKRCADAYVQLGVTFYAMGKKSHARQVWRQAQKKFPSNEAIKMYLRLTNSK